MSMTASAVGLLAIVCFGFGFFVGGAMTNDEVALHCKDAGKYYADRGRWIECTAIPRNLERQQ